MSRLDFEDLMRARADYSGRTEFHHQRLGRSIRDAIATRFKTKDTTTRSSSPTFILCSGENINDRWLTREGLYLDVETLDRHYRSLQKPLGAINPAWGSRFSNSIAHRLSKRCGIELERQTGVDRAAAAQAIFFLLWTELCIFIPARHLARRIAKLAQGDLIVIPIDSNKFSCMRYWDNNQLEPIYLAEALKRFGAHVALSIKDEAERSRILQERSAAIEFSVSSSSFPMTQECHPQGARQNAIVTSGLRNFNEVSALIGDHLMAEATFSASTGAFDFGLLPTGSARPASLTFDLHPTTVAIHSKYVILHETRLTSTDLVHRLVEMIGDVIRSAMDCAVDAIHRYGIRNLHVCDHAFFESALLEHAVRRNGGRVFVWPHSSNAVHTEIRQGKSVAGVICSTRSSAAAWKVKFPSVRCAINSRCVLTEKQERRHFVVGRPLTIVVLGGAHALRRMPLMDYQGHTASFKRLFETLTISCPDVEVFFKPKTTWETADWLREVVGNVAIYKSTDLHPSVIDEPNMIFVTVSLGSTALLEGIGRGIPCMIVREVSTEDYMNFDPLIVPVGSVDMIISHIRSCREPSFYSALMKKQLGWYEEETSFPEKIALRDELDLY